MRSYVQVLTTPTADTPGTTLLLHFDNKRYLLGSLAEGTQRACVQMGARLLKVSECFITGCAEWRNTGGLIGMILTLADSAAASQAASLEEALRKARARAAKLGVADDPVRLRELEDEARTESRNSLTLFGPRNLNHTLATARRYVFRKGMPVDVHEIRAPVALDRNAIRLDENGVEGQGEEKEAWEPYWADNNIKVWALSVAPSDGRPPAQRTTSSSVSPRKRSIDEVYATESSSGKPAVNGSELTPEERDYLEVKAVVSEMFNSTWRLDTLYETRLSDVKLPATVFIRNSQTNRIEKYTGPFPGGPQPVPDPDLKVLVRKPWPGALVERLPDTKPAKEAISYIVKNHTQRGKFHPAKATELKVKQGPNWAQLAAGRSVLNEDGETITPDMVLGQSKPGGGIAVIDIPSTEYIGPLVSKPEWRESAVMSGVGAVVWICGKGVATDPQLHAFMREFKHLKHIVSSPDYCSNYIALDSAAAATIRLNQVDPERYDVPVHDSNISNGSQKYGGSSKSLNVRRDQPLPEGVSIAERGFQVQLEPSLAVKTDQVIPYLDIEEVKASMTPAVMKEATRARQSIAEPDGSMQKWLDSLPPGARETEIITLGTGSALPSKYRNVSATLVRVPDWGNVLLDCGENTIGQLRRIFTEAEFKQVLQDLRIIFISHMHADHQLGTTSIIKAWYEEVHDGQPAVTTSDAMPLASRIQAQNCLAVVSEPAMLHWLAEYSAVEDFGHSHLAPLTISPRQSNRNTPSRLNWFVPPAELKHLPGPDRNALMDANTVAASALNLASIEAVAVQHCHGARAVSITFPSGLKVSYSGDCRPSQAFAQIGRGSTVCIHEATFDDELQGDAEAKNHSTTSEALGVAQAMRAKACVLTHFSQRYQKVPVLERGEMAEEDGLGVVNDDSGSAGGDLAMAEAGGNGTAADPNPEDDAEFAGPLEDDGEIRADDVAATFPEQATEDGGKQYQLPASSKRSDAAAAAAGGGQDTRVTAATGPPEAVKFKLASDMKVCVAFDYMRVKIGDIGHLEKFTPALLELFAEEEKEKAVDPTDGNGGGDNEVKKPGKKKGGKRNN